MKPAIIYFLALLALVHGEDEIHRHESHSKANSRYVNPYKHLLKIGKDGEICAPGSKFESVCRTCYCSEDGTKIICSTNELCAQRPRHRRYVSSTPNPNGTFIIQNTSCQICTCEVVDYSDFRVCSIRHYDVCPLQYESLRQRSRDIISTPILLQAEF